MTFIYTSLEDVERNLHQRKIWQTANGRTLLVQEMGDFHIKNTIEWLRRHSGILKDISDRVVASLPDPNGEAAQELATADQEQQLEEGDVEWVEQTPLFQELVKLANERGIEIKRGVL